FICEFPNCTRAFSTSGHLSRHIKIHTGDKPHECLISNCSKRFSRKDSMIHVKIHTGDRPHECLIQGCARRFTRKDSMMLHFSTH
ncbi:hypothetical protein BC833DRAFT_506857, partial [Globomyces pollinis-pini]